MTTLSDIKELDVRTIIDNNGILSPIESNYDLPFNIKRVYFIHDVKDVEPRGKHAHKKNKQALVCIKGEVTVHCNDGDKTKRYTLNSSSKMLYIPEMIWDEQVYHSEDAILLVLSSISYEPKDYIHNFEQFKKLKNGK